MESKYILLIVTILLLTVLTACRIGNADGDQVSSGKTFSEVSSGADASEIEAEIISDSDSLEAADLYLPPVSFQDEKKFMLQGIAADYIEDYDLFYDKYKRDDLFSHGIIDAASYLIGESRFENLAGDSVLFFTQAQDIVADELGIGSSLASVIDVLGEPCARYEEYNLVMYKTSKFYIAFAGDTVNTIYLSRQAQNPLTQNLLPEFLSSEKKSNFSFADYGMYGAQIWRGTVSYYSPDGICIHEGFDDNFDLFYPMTIYRDYQGLVPEGLSESDGVFFRDIDYPEHKILQAITENDIIESLIVSKAEHESGNEFFSSVFFSPDKKIAMLEFSNCTYERSGFLLRYLDGSLADRFIQVGHFPTYHGMIDSRYLLINSMFGFGVYDVETPYHALFYLRDDTYVGPYIVKEDDKSAVIMGESFTIIQPDKEDVAVSLEDNQELLLSFEHKNDSLTVSYEVRNKD